MIESAALEYTEGRHSFTWTTQDEQAFISGLGRWLRTGVPSDSGYRANALRGYLAGLGKRERWCGMDAEQVKVYALEQLLRVEGKVA